MNKYIFPETSKCIKYDICQKFIIMDLNGFEFNKLNHNAREIITKIQVLASNYQPETIYKTVFINCPFVFKAAWDII